MVEEGLEHPQAQGPGSPLPNCGWLAQAGRTLSVNCLVKSSGASDEVTRCSLMEEEEGQDSRRREAGAAEGRGRGERSALRAGGEGVPSVFRKVGGSRRVTT